MSSKDARVSVGVCLVQAGLHFWRAMSFRNVLLAAPLAGSHMHYMLRCLILRFAFNFTGFCFMVVLTPCYLFLHSQILAASVLRPTLPTQLVALTSVQIIAEPNDGFLAPDLEWDALASEIMKTDRPMLADRRFYLPLWCDDAMDLVPHWKYLSVALHREPESVAVSADQPTIAAVIQTALRCAIVVPPDT